MNITHKSDFDLVHKYLLNDEEAGRQLYLDATPYVEKFVYDRTIDTMLTQQDKEDVIAEALRESIRLLDRYNGKSAFRVFVCGIARNMIQRALRAASKTAKHIALITAEEITDDENYLNEDPLRVLIKKEQYECLQKAFSALKDDYQQIIQFRLFNKVSVKQVALLTGKTEDSIDALYRRALKKYRANFNEIYYSATEKQVDCD